MPTLNEYANFISTERDFRGTRLIVVPNEEVAMELTKLHTEKEPNNQCVRLCDCIDETSMFLPMPDSVFLRLREKIANSDRLAIVSGIHAYLLFLDPEKRNLAFSRLKGFLDSPPSQSIVLIPADWREYVLNMTKYSPKYEEGKELIYIEGETTTNSIEIVLVDQAWVTVQPPDCHSFHECLKTIDDFPTLSNGRMIVALPDNNRKIPGLHVDVKQVHSLADCMRYFYGVDDPLSDSVLRWILNECQELNIKDARTALQRKFFAEDVHLSVAAPRRIIDDQEDTPRSALIWYLKHKVKANSYLYAVITDPNFDDRNFFAHYVAHGAVQRLQHKNAAFFSKERSEALKELDDRKSIYIKRFIEQVKDAPLSQVAVWLNNNTQAEHEEFVRRFAESHIPGLYPHLDNYLADYDYGTDELTSYFNRYRRYKLRNNVDAQFCDEAIEISFGQLPSRESELTKNVHGAKTAVLVVDAMGAEYLPFIVEQTAKRSLKIEKHCAVLSRYPTSTQFNKIDPACEKLPEMKGLDVIVHDGTKAHQQNTYYENIAAVLDRVFSEIFNCLEQNMSQFDRIILTADHGASRLAVLAYELGFAKTLDNPCNEKPDDWRYIQAPPGKCPEEFIETLDGKYWVVRGYNRLPKQGSKLYELHGGYTAEECLVPFVVFNKTGTPTIPSQRLPQQQKPKQIVEKDDFDL